MKTVSVLMSTCNGGAHIAAQLESIRRQNLRPLELWVSDDGSSDETLRIVTRFAENVPFPVRICVNGEETDPRANVLNAALLCEGDIIAFCAQGDEWHPGKLSRCVAEFEAPEVMLVAHSATILDAQSRYAGYLSQGIQCSQAYPALTLPPWGSFLAGTMVFRRDLLAWPPAREQSRRPDAAGQVMRADRWLYALAHGLGSIVTLAHPLMATRHVPPHPEGLLRKLLAGHGRLSPLSAARRLRHLEATAMQRSQVMSALVLARPPRLQVEAARAAAVFWQRMAMICALRAAVYDAPTFARRKVAFDRLVALGSYSLARGEGLAGGLLVRDALTGLLQLPGLVPSVADAGPVEAGPGLESWAWPH